MESAATVELTVNTLKLSGGHQALDFTNTVNSRGARYRPDVLRSYADLLDWAIRVGVLTSEEASPLRDLPREQAEAALERAKALREALYRVFSSAGSPDPVDLDVVQKNLRSAQDWRILAASPDGYRWSWKPGDPDAVAHRVASAATELLVSPVLSRVHVCPGTNCGWLFLDTSRAGRRLWCSEETCGNRDRVRRWRERRKSAPGPPGRRELAHDKD
jgi:predicted RNA-binding Zn ribbon-like protein